MIKKCPVCNSKEVLENSDKLVCGHCGYENIKNKNPIRDSPKSKPPKNIFDKLYKNILRAMLLCKTEINKEMKDYEQKNMIFAKFIDFEKNLMGIFEQIEMENSQ